MRPNISPILPQSATIDRNTHIHIDTLVPDAESYEASHESSGGSLDHIAPADIARATHSTVVSMSDVIEVDDDGGTKIGDSCPQQSADRVERVLLEAVILSNVRSSLLNEFEYFERDQWTFVLATPPRKAGQGAMGVVYDVPVTVLDAHGQTVCSRRYAIKVKRGATPTLHSSSLEQREAFTPPPEQESHTSFEKTSFTQEAEILTATQDNALKNAKERIESTFSKELLKPVSSYTVAAAQKLVDDMLHGVLRSAFPLDEEAFRSQILCGVRADTYRDDRGPQMRYLVEDALENAIRTGPKFHHAEEGAEVTDFVDGTVLEEVIMTQKLSYEARLVLAYLEAVAFRPYIEGGHLHDDIKPSNVMLQIVGEGTDRPRVLVVPIDTGLAESIPLNITQEEYDQLVKDILGDEEEEKILEKGQKHRKRFWKRFGNFPATFLGKLWRRARLPQSEEQKLLAYNPEERIAGTVGYVDLHDACVGTPAFMSPEQAAGNCITETSDTFALGVVFAKQILGRNVVKGKTAGNQLRDRARITETAVLDRLGDIPDASLQELLLGMLQSAPGKRWTLAEVVDHMESYLIDDAMIERVMPELVTAVRSYKVKQEVVFSGPQHHAGPEEETFPGGSHGHHSAPQKAA